MLSASLCKHLQDIFPISSTVHDIPFCLLRVPHAKAIVMLGRKRDVRHSGFFCHQNPLIRVEIYGVEMGWELLVFLEGYPIIVENPLAPTKKAVHTPMNKETEPCLPEPFPVAKISLARNILREFIWQLLQISPIRIRHRWKNISTMLWKYGNQQHDQDYHASMTKSNADT
jgi:hypothetical protein